MIIISQVQAVYERVRKAEGPDRKLDAAIAEAFGWKNVRYGKFGKGWTGTPPDCVRSVTVPNYTRSFDSTLSLLPPLWVESYYARFDGIFVAECHPRSDLSVSTPYPREESSSRTLAMLAVILHSVMLTKPV